MIKEGNVSKQSNKDLEPYEPNFSPGSSPQPYDPYDAPARPNPYAPAGGYPPHHDPPPPTVIYRGPGCAERALLISAGSCVLIVVIVLAFAWMGIGVIGEIARDINFPFSGDRVIEVDVQHFVLSFQEQAFLETGRELQQVRVTVADQVRLGDLVPMPADRRIELEAYVTVTAGVDLRLMEAGDIRVEDDTMIITLPQVQIKDCIYNVESSRMNYNTYCSTPLGTCRDLEELARNRAMQDAATQNVETIQQRSFESAIFAISDLALQFGHTGPVEVRQSEESLPTVAENGTCYSPELASPTPGS